MKKVTFLLTALFALALSFNSFAQSKTGAAFFTGEWNVLLKGTPNGDAKMVFKLDKSGDDMLTGVVNDSTGTEISKMSKVELTDSTVTVYFTAQGYDVNILLTKKDEDHVTGSLMGMFDVEGERKKK